MAMRHFSLAAMIAALLTCTFSADSIAQKVPSGMPAQTATDKPTAPAPKGGTPAAPNPNAVNINTASSEDLMKLPGMTGQRATAIMRGRPYANVDELSSRKILKPATLERVRPYIMVQ